MNEIAKRQGVATQSNIAKRAKPLSEVMVDLLNESCDPELEKELCLQLDIFCCTLHAATTGTLSFTVPVVNSLDVAMLNGSRNIWRGTEPEYVVELEHKLRDDDHIRELMLLTDELHRRIEDGGMLPVFATSREVNFSFGNDAELEGDISMRYLDSITSRYTERQLSLMSLMTYVSPEMRDGVRRINDSKVPAKTELEKRLKRLCIYLERFYTYGLENPMWQGDPWTRSYNKDAPRIGNQGMRPFDV